MHTDNRNRTTVLAHYLATSALVMTVPSFRETHRRLAVISDKIDPAVAKTIDDARAYMTAVDTHLGEISKQAKTTPPNARQNVGPASALFLGLETGETGSGRGYTNVAGAIKIGQKLKSDPSSSLTEKSMDAIIRHILTSPDFTGKTTAWRIASACEFVTKVGGSTAMQEALRQGVILGGYGGQVATVESLTGRKLSNEELEVLLAGNGTEQTRTSLQATRDLLERTAADWVKTISLWRVLTSGDPKEFDSVFGKARAA